MQAEFTDAEWFGLAEATFQAAMLLAHVGHTLEQSAYEMLEPKQAAEGLSYNLAQCSKHDACMTDLWFMPLPHSHVASFS